MAASDPEMLLVLAKAGDGEALGRLIERHRGYLILLARMQIGRLLRGKLDAEDLLQETSLEAHRGVARFRGTTEVAFRAWLRQILAAVLSNQVRRYRGTKGRDARLERRLVEDLDRSSRALDRGLIAEQSSPSQQVARRERALLLAEALAILPEDYRDVIVLRHLEGLGFAEVALRMGRTEDSVKNLWVRALARLRRTLDDPR
ncbi:MAG TPA: sigma-70 family RNA polymerase sigma factor [Isosphaeraceae bacterium]|jgi:RNA polymerase sigma-70 factor (ECF subfamily)